MLVDLGRNDIGRVCDYGTVRVPTFMALERYSHVMHLVSVVEGQLAEGRDRLDALVSCFPAGTVSGAPKVRAMQIINELEPTRRGLYAGAVGYLDFAGNLDFCIAIRSILLERRQGLHPGRRRHRRRLESDRGVRRDARQGARDDSRAGARAGRVVDRWSWSSTTTIRLPTTSSSTSASWARRSWCAATTRRRSSSCARSATIARRDLAGSRTAGTGRRLARGDQGVRAAHAAARRVPRPPGDRPGVWRRGDSRAAADSRQDLHRRAQRQGRLRRTQPVVPGRPLSLADRRRDRRCRPISR